MGSYIEPLERRKLFSTGFPIVANDAAVKADQAKIDADAATTANDKATFKALLASDKQSLDAINRADKAVVSADKKQTRTDKKHPTALAKDQATLQADALKLIGDVAAAKARISTDSAHSKETLNADHRAADRDTKLLKTDTKAAEEALKLNTRKLLGDFAGILAPAAATETQVQALSDDLLIAGRATGKPSTDALGSFAADFAGVFDSGALSRKQQSRIAADALDAVNSSSVASAAVNAVVTALHATLVTTGISPGSVTLLTTDFQAILLSTPD